MDGLWVPGLWAGSWGLGSSSGEGGPISVGMDPVSLDPAISQSVTKSKVDTAVARTAGDVVKQEGEAAVAMMQQAIQLQKAMTEAARARGGVDVVG